MRHPSLTLLIAGAALACTLFALAALPAWARRDRAPSAPADSGIVVEVDADGSAELADSRGTLRVFSGDVRIEYRAGGQGAGLDAGAVTLDGRPLRAEVKKGGTTYKAGRQPDASAGGNPWLTLMNSGGVVPADTVRIKLAAYPTVTRPVPGQAVARGDELQLVMLPPVPDVWYRVTLIGTATVSAIDMHEGRWVFPAGSLANLEAGAARLMIEIETSCAACPVGPRLRATVSSRSQLEIPITLL
jgi:hypothetical protein